MRGGAKCFYDAPQRGYPTTKKKKKTKKKNPTSGRKAGKEGKICVGFTLKKIGGKREGAGSGGVRGGGK